VEKLYLDDLHIGRTFESGEHVLEVEEIIDFARQYDPQPFHTDPDAAERTFFGGLAASGWHTAAITMRLIVVSVPIAHGVIGAGGEVRWPTPARTGDVLRVNTTIETITPSRSRPGRAAVHVHCVTCNQHGEIRQEFRPRLIAWKRGAAPE
jgi:acyl dehydratase